MFAVDPEHQIPSDWHLHHDRALAEVGLEIELMESRADQLQLAVRSALSPESATHHIGVESLGAMRTFEDTSRVRVLVSELIDGSVDLAHFLWEGLRGGERAAWAEVDKRLVIDPRRRQACTHEGKSGA